MKVFNKGRSRLFGGLALAVFCGGGFAATSLFNVSRYGNTPIPAIQSFRMDSDIPFVAGWVWIYLLYYPFCFLPLFLHEVRNDPKTFTKTVTAYSLQFAISFGIFLVWPLRMAHQGLPRGLDGAILHQLYAVDLGFSSFPSLHLANIVFVSLIFLRLRGARWGIAVSGIAGLIAASTLLVKQHYISDVIVGAFIGWASFAAAFTSESRDSRAVP